MADLETKLNKMVFKTRRKGGESGFARAVRLGKVEPKARPSKEAQRRSVALYALGRPR